MPDQTDHAAELRKLIKVVGLIKYKAEVWHSVGKKGSTEHIIGRELLNMLKELEE